ncbi:hypothetical protein AU210_003813 [Fusarium oxysporum f. sp. radicis-cucumerinum]|uniref:Peptidase S8/S53 domain-containing protein n=1 Tax=Fusarium oxysporum f. sp. radicis-cucumerinum TaxID=327505 RepID=A0A2H3HFD2_FUSOX|nr:hypothetical protein AU210_003813 [Fusarium oxysporum f. sp. radicis-cucumerinum]
MNTLHPSRLKNEDAKKVFDELEKEILNFSDRIFQSKPPADSSQATFTLSERVVASKAGSGSFPEEVVVCPKARLHETTVKKKTKVFKCRCCCVDEPHSDGLTYKLIKEKSFLREELHPSGLRKWFIVTLKPETLQLVIVRLSEVSPIYSKEVETLSKNIASQGISSERGIGTAVRPRTMEMIQNDWVFPSTKIMKVILHSFNTTTLLPKPSSVELKHFGVLQSPHTEKDVGHQALTNLLPQSYFCILSRGSHSDEEDWEVRVNSHTRICHETNPLGRLVVTLQNTTVPQAMTQAQQGPEGDVHFYFDLREDAQLFAAYLKAAQDRLRELFVRGPMENEKIVDSRLFDADYSLRTQANGWREFPIPAEDDTQARIRFMLVALQEDGEQRYKTIMSREGYADAVCIDFKDKTPQISQRGLLKSLEDIEVWISDYDSNGKSVVSQMSWGDLTRRETKPRSLRATFIKSENERTAGDWLDEVDDLIRAMRGDRKDPYERVKIAIIDSGLHDRERDRYQTEYKDFSGVATNDSWHGTCCAGIIQGMYEEARLYIARVFERDHADEIEGPLRMARAIHWAIEPPRSVDIISISAGFRNYSKELDDAVTRAKAAGVLVVAAASNWQNTNTVAFPARHNLSTMCIYSTNTGNQSSSFNPEPRADTQNFAILGEGFQHPDQRRNERMNGTSMATAVAAGLAARIVDFSRQNDNKASIFRAQDVGKLPGMLAIFSAMSKPAGNLRYISPLELLPLRHGVSREADRQRVREVLSQAMERAN